MAHPRKPLIAACNETAIQLWSLPDGKLQQTLPLAWPLRRVAFSLDGRLIAAIGQNLEVWQITERAAAFDRYTCRDTRLPW